MKIIDSFDNEFLCHIGCQLRGIRLKKVYIWEEELKCVDWDEYEKVLKKKFIDKVLIKINKRFEKKKEESSRLLTDEELPF